MKIGDYVKTKYGIGKYIDDEIKSEKIIVIDRYIAYDHIDYYKNIITPSEIIKSSSNIIDLIEVGDYVNGDIVIKSVPKDKRKKQIIIIDSTSVEYGEVELKNEDIKTILTKEQYDFMKYKV